jgi:hypothetical protein
VSYRDLPHGRPSQKVEAKNKKLEDEYNGYRAKSKKTIIKLRSRIDKLNLHKVELETEVRHSSIRSPLRAQSPCAGHALHAHIAGWPRSHGAQLTDELGFRVCLQLKDKVTQFETKINDLTATTNEQKKKLKVLTAERSTLDASLCTRTHARK